MTISVVQAQSLTSGGPTTGSITSAGSAWPANVTTGNTLIVPVFNYWSGDETGVPGETLSVTDSNGNTYTKESVDTYTYSTSGDFTLEVSVWRCHNATGGNKPTITANVIGVHTTEFAAIEVAGLQNTAPATVGGDGNDSAGAGDLTVLSGSVTTSQTSTLSVSAAYSDGTIGTPTGYTSFINGGVGGGSSGAAYRINSAALTGHNPNWGSGSYAYCGVTIVYQAPAAGGGPAAQPSSLLTSMT